MTTAGEARLDMDRIREALVKSRLAFEGMDQADTMRHDAPTPHQSAVRTLLEHAERAADRVMEFIGHQADRNDPSYEPPGRDGGGL